MGDGERGSCSCSVIDMFLSHSNFSQHSLVFFLFLSEKCTPRGQSVKGNSTVQEAGGALSPQLKEEGSTDGGTEGSQHLGAFGCCLFPGP